jgi:hypothetical protein
MLFLLGSLFDCSRKPSCHDEMIAILQKVKRYTFDERNTFSPAAKLLYMDSLLRLEHTKPDEKLFCEYLKANILLELGEEEKAVEILEAIARHDYYNRFRVLRDLGIAYLRLGERSNCISNHAAASCILPIRGVGVHQDVTGSEKAIEIYKQLLEHNPDDLESRWLLNIAYMTIGEYPSRVPKQYLIPGMEGDTTEKVAPFIDIAGDLKLDVNTMAGGSITDDFDNDGYLDLMISALYVSEQVRYFKNNGDGTFTELTEQAGLKNITGGLNMVQADYNNDGFKDVLVLRGAWQGDFGDQPNSLLRNNGDGTFTDVTTVTGLLSFHPTQTATWNDFNNDGWLDLFIGNETVPGSIKIHPCELYINNKNGTFREVASQSNCNIMKFVKGVTSGDYDHDGWKDIFISTMNGQRFLLKNMGYKNQEIAFEDVTEKAGLHNEHGNTFPTWFWDFDNDGWLDIFACDYTFKETLAVYEAAEKLNIPAGNPEKMLLYHNNQDGTFTNVANDVGLTTNVFAMGSNFGDIDNDGWLDMYLGTGNPNYQSLVPNKMFRNKEGKHFSDVTASARVGHLQKGHGVSFADMDNDGDQDIHIEMGGAYPGDAYQNSFFMNPGQGSNHWITIQLQGTTSNRDAIGSSLEIHITEEGKKRTIYRDVNSGGSFGSSPLRREIGLGRATKIDQLVIRWHGSNFIQTFNNIQADQFISIREGETSWEKMTQKKIIWILPDQLCEPIAMN